MLFLEGDGYLDGDAVFGVKNSLVVRMEPDPAGGQRIRYDFGLVPVPATADLRAAS
jgi:hypothetical protein